MLLGTLCIKNLLADKDQLEKVKEQLHLIKILNAASSFN